MRPNKLILIASVITLLVLSLVTIWSTAPELFLSQLAFVIAGIIIVYLVSKTDINLILGFSWFWYFLSLFLLILTFFVGKNIRGSVRWIDLGFFNLQTSEIAKPLLALFYANYLAKNPLDTYKKFITFFGISLIPVILIARQPDLGSALSLLFLTMAMFVLAGYFRKMLVVVAVSLLVLVPIESSVLKPYQRQRLATFINPYTDPQGAGYNVIQATIAVGSGGLLGKGVKLGTQTHLNFLPERHTDFIFASFSEEFGFLGISLLFAAYYTAFSFIIKSASLFRHLQHRLLTLGIFSVFVFQTIVNIGMNLGLMPVTGITLPIFSYGGSSLLSFAIFIGLQLRLLDLITPFEL